MRRFSLFALAAALSIVFSFARADEPKAKPAAASEKPATDRATLIKQFEEQMSGATLVGYFTTNGQEQKTDLKEEKYLLKSVKKLPNGDYWLFEYQYGDGGKAIPLPLEIKWAGDTPVITLTDLKIPGVGTFTARVLFYRDEYAGTWSASDHGGKLFGRIVKEEKP